MPFDPKPHYDYTFEVKDAYAATDFTERKVRALRYTFVDIPESSQSFVWPDYVVMLSRSRKDKGENVARYTKMFTFKDGDAWMHCDEAADFSFGQFYGTMRINETSLSVCGADPWQWRLGWHTFVRDARRAYAGDGSVTPGPCEVSTWWRGHGEKNAYVGNWMEHRDFSWSWAQVTGGYMGNPSTHLLKVFGDFLVGVCFGDANVRGSVLRLKRGQTIAFEGTDTIKMGLSATDNKVHLYYGDVPHFTFDMDTKSVTVHGDLIVKGKVRQG